MALPTIGKPRRSALGRNCNMRCDVRNTSLNLFAVSSAVICLLGCFLCVRSLMGSDILEWTFSGTRHVPGIGKVLRFRWKRIEIGADCVVVSFGDRDDSENDMTLFGNQERGDEFEWFRNGTPRLPPYPPQAHDCRPFLDAPCLRLIAIYNHWEERRGTVLHRDTELVVGTRISVVIAVAALAPLLRIARAFRRRRHAPGFAVHQRRCDLDGHRTDGRWQPVSPAASAE